jgi:hypothetical protein
LPEEIDHSREGHDPVRVGGVDVKVTEQHVDGSIVRFRREDASRTGLEGGKPGVKRV